MINVTNIEEAKILLKKAESPKVVLAQNDDFNRRLLEYSKFDILLSPEAGSKKNSLRQIDSGLNHVLAKIASKNNIGIGIDLEELKKLTPKQKAERLSKIMQNIKICRKSKTRLAVKTKNASQVRNFLIGIGASTNQLKETIVF